MPGDPKECREHAKQCFKLAELALTPDAKAYLFELARTWLKLASELETAKGLLDDWGEAAGGKRADRE